MSGRFIRAHAYPAYLFRFRDGSPGDFLARLWTLFGAPDTIDDAGFTYTLRDTEAGVAFAAASGAGGPGYHTMGDERGLAAVLDAFDALIDRTPLSDCSITLSGGFTIGAVAGQPFERLAPPPPPAESIAAARAALAAASADHSAAFGALLELQDGLERLPAALHPADVQALATALWRKALAGCVATVERELARGGKANVNTLIGVVDVFLHGLADTAGDAAVSFGEETAPHQALFERARRYVARKRHR